MEGGREGGRPFLRAEPCDGLEQSGAAGGGAAGRGVSAGGPASVGAPRPAKTQGAASVPTGELAALFVCLRAERPRLKQYGTSAPPGSPSDAMRIRSEAMKTSLVRRGGGRAGTPSAALCSAHMLAAIVPSSVNPFDVCNGIPVGC